MYRFRNRNIYFSDFVDDLIGLAAGIVIIAGIIVFLVGLVVFETKRENKILDEGMIYLNDKFQNELLLYKSKIHPEVFSQVKNAIEEKNFENAARIISALKNQKIILDTRWINLILFDEKSLENIATAIGKNAVKDPMPWSRFWNSVLFYDLPIFWAILNILVFGSFLLEMSEDEERLLDIPWKKPWLWIFVILTTPLNIPFFVASGIRLGIERMRERSISQRTPQPYSTITPDPNTAPIHIKEHKRTQYKNLWVKARIEAKLDVWQKEVAELEKLVNRHQEELRKAGQAITNIQSNLAKTKQDLSKTVANKPLQSNPNELALYNEEFENLLRLPQIKEIFITESNIVVDTKTIIVNIGKHYDLGDYRITISIYEKSLEVRCMRQSKGNKHIYLSGDNYFCFGNRNELLQRTLNKREFLPAVCIALEGLYHINSSDKAQIPQLFEEVV